MLEYLKLVGIDLRPLKLNRTVHVGSRFVDYGGVYLDIEPAGYAQPSQQQPCHPVLVEHPPDSLAEMTMILGMGLLFIRLQVLLLLQVLGVDVLHSGLLLDCAVYITGSRLDCAPGLGKLGQLAGCIRLLVEVDGAGHLVYLVGHEVNTEAVHLGAVLQHSRYLRPGAVVVALDRLKGCYVDQGHLEGILGIQLLRIGTAITFLPIMLWTTRLSFYISSSSSMPSQFYPWFSSVVHPSSYRPRRVLLRLFWLSFLLNLESSQTLQTSDFLCRASIFCARLRPQPAGSSSGQLQDWGLSVLRGGLLPDMSQRLSIINEYLHCNKFTPIDSIYYGPYYIQLHAQSLGFSLCFCLGLRLGMPALAALFCFFGLFPFSLDAVSEDNVDEGVEDEGTEVKGLEQFVAEGQRKHLEEGPTHCEGHVGADPQTDPAEYPQFLVQFHVGRLLVLALLEYELGDENLEEPQEERDVVAPVEPVPKGTHHEGQQLAHNFVLVVHPLVHALPEPLLTGHVPVGDLLPRVDCRFHHNRVAGLNQVEVRLAVPMHLVRYPRGVDGSHAELPGEVVLEPEQGHTGEGVEHDEPEPAGGELSLLHVGQREEEHVHCVEKHQDESEAHIPADHLPGRGHAGVLVAEAHVVLVVDVREGGADGRAGQELAVPHEPVKRGQLLQSLLELLLRELVEGCLAILVGVGEQRVLVDIGHHDGGDVECPAPVVDHHPVDVIDRQQGQRDDGHVLAAVPGVEGHQGVHQGVQQEDQVDVLAVDVVLDEGACQQGVQFADGLAGQAWQQVAEGDACQHRYDHPSLVL